ncbi:hypothetical protein WJX75_003701 [Coccomyxa subellipsoidea]|uniref:PWWP domain-containing protein n=1 Tax=Coccomyxa subellipsoidea TaxID=248742 RepID=A0ABR2YMD2_9CHLO
MLTRTTCEDDTMLNCGLEPAFPEQAQEALPATSHASEDANAGSESPGPSENPPPLKEEQGVGGNAPGWGQDTGDGAAGGNEDPNEAEGYGALAEPDANRLGASCLLACLMVGFTKREALCMGVAAECWAHGHIPWRNLYTEQATAAGLAMAQGNPEAGPSQAQAAKKKAQKRKASDSPEVAKGKSAEKASKSQKLASKEAQVAKGKSAKKVSENPEVAISEKEAKGKSAKKVEESEEEEDDEDVFDVDKHVVRGMVVLLRTKEESGSGWRHPWSVARVNRVDKAMRSMSVTWLKPMSQKQWWTQRWVPWMVEGATKEGSKLREGVWSTQKVELDTVQWGTHLSPNDTFQKEDIDILRQEVKRIEAASME